MLKIFIFRRSHSFILILLVIGFSTFPSNNSIAQAFGQKKSAGPFQLTYQPAIFDTINNPIHFSRLNNAPGSKASKLSSNASNLNSCNTSTFYMHLVETSGKKIELKELQTLPDGNFIIAGNITLANSEQEGLFCVLSNSGSIVSQKQIRINSEPVTISTIKILLNGKIAVTGILHDATDKVFAAVLNTNMTADWIKVFDMPSQPIKITLDFFDNSQIALATQLSTSIIYSLMNMDGSVAWNKQVFPAGLNGVVGFGESTYSELSLVLNCTRSGKQLVEVLKIERATGSVLASYILGSGVDESRYLETVSYSGRQIALGITKKSATQFQLVRDIMYPGNIIETEHTYTLPGNIDFNTTGSMDNAGDALGLCLPQDGKLVFIRHFSYYQTPPEYTRQYSVPIGATISAVARSFNDGGYLFGLNTSGSQELILVKTDSIGRIAGCGYEDVANDYTETLGKQNTVSSTTSMDVSVLTSSATISNNNSSLSGAFDCKENYCPPPPPDDTCLSTYFKTLRSNSYADAFTKYYLMRNDNQLVTTQRYDRVLGNGNQLTGGVKLFDDKGHFIKGVEVFCDGISSYMYSRQIDDQHIMLINYEVKNGLPCFAFTLIDDNLQILWTKSIQAFSDYNFYTGSAFGDLVRDKEGNYYFVQNSLGFNEKPKVLAYKMDANGNPLWLKIYDLQTGLFLTCNATTTNTSLVIIIEGDHQGSVSVRLDKATGQMLNAFMYQNDCAGSVYDRLVDFDNGRIYYAGNDGQDQFVMGVFDTTGRPIKMKTFTGLGSIMRAATVKSGMLYAFYNYYNGSASKNVLLKADSSLTLQFINEYDIMLYGFPVGMGISDNGSIYMGGNFWSGGGNGNYYDPDLQKFDPSGAMGTCGYTTSNPTITDINLNTTAISFNPITRAFTPIDIAIDFIPDTDGQNINSLLCSSISQCDTIEISGTTSVCQLNQNYTYHSKRNPECTLKPVWLYDTSFAILQASTDSTSVFQFKKPGSTWIKAKLDAGCNVYWDSLLIEIQKAPVTFSLGRDTSLCPGANIKLNAGDGFNSYQWQDGSTDSGFTVKAPGKYFVSVNNLCGDVYNDTIIVSGAIVPMLSIGNDSSICFNDTLYIKASGGFGSYQWQSSALINGQGQNVFVVATKNELVSLIATTNEGCHAHDTLNVKVILPQPVSLGGDQNICASDSVTLFAGNNFLQYSWNTGGNTPGITVTQTGTYWIQTIDKNGCKARDTINVAVYALPAFDLGVDLSLCKGEQKILDAGNFDQYLWQDGSTARYYTAETIGTYWARVTDNHHCSSSDTIAVKEILPLPAGFLQKSDSICQYEILKIVPLKSFSSYSWSTGSSQSFVTIDKPGFYTLTVRDENGCVGADTIVIDPRTCNSGLWVPSAFTPNNDGINDVFRPLLFGKVTKYQFIIYNRWGEKVFETTDLQKAWDGKAKGIPQSSYVFIWQCFYQFEGGNPSSQKGTVTLIR